MCETENCKPVERLIMHLGKHDSFSLTFKVTKFLGISIIPYLKENTPFLGISIIPYLKENTPFLGISIIPYLKENTPFLGISIIPYLKENTPFLGISIIPYLKENTPFRKMNLFASPNAKVSRHLLAIIILASNPHYRPGQALRFPEG